MGVWGDGLFENDYVLDYVDSYVTQCVNDLEAYLNILSVDGYEHTARTIPYILHIIQLIDRQIGDMLYEHLEVLEKLQQRFADELADLHSETSKLTLNAFDTVVQLARAYHEPHKPRNVVREDAKTFKIRQQQIVDALDTPSYKWKLIRSLKKDIQNCLYDLRPEINDWGDCVPVVLLPGIYLMNLLIENFGLEQMLSTQLNTKHARLWKEDYLDYVARRKSAEEIEFDETHEKVIHETFDKLIATLEKPEEK